MNRHLKIAFVVAPFLLVGGYILGDYYAKYEHGKKTFTYPLTKTADCDVLQTPCVLEQRELRVKVSDQEGLTRIDSSHVLNGVALSYLDSQGKEWPFTLEPLEPVKRVWGIKTDIREKASQGEAKKIRLVLIMEQSYFITELDLPK